MTSEIRANTLKNRVGLGTIEYSNTGPVISGVTTAFNFKTGTSNLHNTGLNIFDLEVDGHANLDNVSISGVTTTSHIHLTDNNEIRLGTGSGGDTKIVHVAGSHTEINHIGSGDLVLETINGGDDILLNSNDDIFLQHQGEMMVECRSDDGVKLYFDNSEKIATISNGVQITGTVDVNGGGITLEDTAHIELGNSADLLLKHDGSNSYILNSTGFLNIKTTGGGAHYIDADDQYFRTSGGENLVHMIGDGGVNLYFDNSKKLETVTGGVYVYGDIVGAVGGTGNIYLGDNNKFIAGSGNDVQIFHDGNNQINYANGNLIIKQGSHTNAQALQFDGNGHLYVPDNEMIYFGGSADLKIYHDGSHSHIKDSGTGELLLSGSVISLNNAASSEYMLKATENGSVELYYDNQKRLYTDADGVTIGQTAYAQLKIDGQVGDCILSSSGAQIEFTRASSSNILCSNSAGYLNFFTGGQTTYPAMRIFASTGHTASGAKVGINTDAVGVDTVMSVMAQPGQPALYSSYGMRIMPNGANSFNYPGHYITNASGVYVIHATIPANNTWTQVAAGRYHGATVTARIGDASSKRTIFANYDFTAPNYGVAHYNEIANNGNWNTGSASMRVASAGTYDYAIEVQHNSYYNTSNNSSVHLIFNVC